MSVLCTDADLNTRYGTTNVAHWADVDGTWVRGSAESAAMTARRLAARTYASNYFEDRLRCSDKNFSLPITGTVPTTVVDVCVKIAGYWLSTPRDLKGFDRDGNPVTKLYGDFRDALATIEQIVKGDLKPDW